MGGCRNCATMVMLIIGVSIILHEFAHVIVGLRLGGRWRGLRIRWTRIAVVLDMTGLSGRQRRQVAAAGLFVDVLFWCTFLGLALVAHSVLPSVRMGVLWFSCLLVVNATPWIRGSDGWHLWQKGEVEELMNPLKSINPIADAESQEIRKKPWWLHKRGQVLPLVAIALPVLIGMAGVSLTVGTVYFAQAKLQNAVDAAALAGAQEMTTTDAAAPGDQASLITQDDAAATHPHVSAQTTPGNTVLATATATVPGTFAALFGYKTFTIHAHAVAQYGPGPAFDYAIFQGDPGTPLTIHGSETIIGGVHSNGNLDAYPNHLIQGACTAGGSSYSASGNCISMSIGAQIPVPVWQPPAGATNLATFCTGTNGCKVITTNPHDITIVGPLPQGNYYVNFGSLHNNPNNYTDIGQVTFSQDGSLDGSLSVYNGSIVLDGNHNSGIGSGGLALAAFGGNIILNGNISVTGVLYAPEGNINPNGGGQRATVVGAVVAQTIGGDGRLDGQLKITYDANQVAAVPDQQVALIQ